MPKDSDPAAPEWAPGSCPWVNTILPDPCAGLEAVDPFGWVVLCLARRRMRRGRLKWGATPLLAMCWPDCRSKREGRQGGLSVITGSEAGTRTGFMWGSGTNAKVDRVPRKVGNLLSLSSRRAGTWKEFRGTGVFIRQTAFTTSMKQAVEGTRGRSDTWKGASLQPDCRLQLITTRERASSLVRVASWFHP